MKRNFLAHIILYSIAACITISACDNAPKGDEATIKEEQKVSENEGQNFIVDTSISRVHFIGFGVGKNHPGVFHLASGSLAISGNQITSGEFLLNIKSLELDQKDPMVQSKLHPHLLSEDFFDAEKFGTAKFEITNVEPYKADGKDTTIVKDANFNISANLTIKDITKNITFPARIDLDVNTLKAKANFDIDRTQWKINYGNDKSLGDKFISETVNIKLALEAKAQ